MGLLTDKVCLVTGGAGSIGLASARRFLREGARVMLSDRSADALARAIDGLPADRIATTVSDVREATEVRALIEQTVERFGLIDVLFSNAGNAGAIAPLEQYPEDVFDDVYRVHVRGALLVLKYGIPCMQDGGSVIITSSVAGLRGDPGAYAYIAAKHAQIGIMRCAAKEVAPRKIRVNTIHPGPTRNDFQSALESQLSTALGCNATELFDQMTPLGRHAEPDEIASSVLYLASSQSAHVTGTRLVVDGGMQG
jgi:NAD(P)-dependent dehydrogenase (short-subunit alcohol dehydrogenase family)